MLRELQVHEQKAVNAQYKAAKAMVTGMGVVLNHADGTVKFADADTVDGFYFVNKERVPTGVDAARTEISDYDEIYVNVAANEFVKLQAPVVGERYGTDQYVEATLEAGKPVALGTDGKFKIAGEASRYVCAGFQMDGSHKLLIISVEAKAVSAE